MLVTLFRFEESVERKTLMRSRLAGADKLE